MDKRKKFPGSHWRNLAASKKRSAAASECLSIKSLFQTTLSNTQTSSSTPASSSTSSTPDQIVLEKSVDDSGKPNTYSISKNELQPHSSIASNNITDVACDLEIEPLEERQSADNEDDDFDGEARGIIGMNARDPANPLPKERLLRSDRISKGPYQPHRQAYPKTNGRCFLKQWFEDFQWLEYSEVEDKAYCFYCRCFAVEDAATRGTKSDTFITRGFQNWRKAQEKMKSHQLSMCHQTRRKSFHSFSTSVAVDCQLDDQKARELSEREKQRMKNREAMSRLVDIVICLAKGGRPFRGNNEMKSSSERGLFLELVSLIAKYDPVLKSHLDHAPRNAIYLSNRSQNDMIQALQNVLFLKIKDELDGRQVAIIADETTDCGHFEQLAVVIRFFDKVKRKPSERFVAIRRLTSVNSEAVFSATRKVEEELGILPENIVGCCFDGASTMAGCEKGVQARYKAINPKILYVHCYAHCLNLTLVAACTSHPDNACIFDFFGVVQLIYNFIEKSPIRHATFEKIVRETDQKLHSLKSLSTTRWACRAEAVTAIQTQLQHILSALENVARVTNDPLVKVKAKNLLKNILDFKFLLCLEMMPHILNLILVVSKRLQSPQMDLIAAMDDVKALSASLQDLRDSNWFHEVYARTETLCDNLEVDIPLVRKRRPPNRLDDHPETQATFETKEHEMRVKVFTALLDCLLQGLDQRFGKEVVDIITSVGRVLILKPENSDLRKVSARFGLDFHALEAELKLLNSTPHMNLEQRRQPLVWLTWLSSSNKSTTFQQFTKMIEEFLVLPVTSCTCERVFSKLPTVKSKLRSTMSQKRLNNLMLPYVEQDLVMEVSIEEVLDAFRDLVDRRINL